MVSEGKDRKYRVYSREGNVYSESIYSLNDSTLQINSSSLIELTDTKQRDRPESTQYRTSATATAQRERRKSERERKIQGTQPPEPEPTQHQ